MIEQFKKLPAVERKNILDACIEEFGKKGYERASTNVIVKNAGIPKGTLFYYFGNKKQLFLYLVDYAVERYIEYVNTYFDDLPQDVFDRLIYMVDIRMRFAVHSLELYRFFFRTLLNIPDVLKKDMQKRFKKYSEGNQSLMRSGLDTSRLREDVSVEQVVKLVNYTMEGLLARHTENLLALKPSQTLDYVEKLLVQSNDLFDLLKKGIYKT